MNDRVKESPRDGRMVRGPSCVRKLSDRTPGGNVVSIQLSGATVPQSVTAFDVTVHVAGRDFTKRVLKSAQPPPDGQSVLFAWDGKDADGNYPVGPQWATIRVSDVYATPSGEAHWNPRIWGGTLGTWDTRAIGLGGWSVNVLHYYDPKEQVLYLGDGSRRSGARLGAVKENGDETFIASEDGLDIYVFDTATGRHKRTLHGLTKAVVYTFVYNDSGTLASIVDGDSNTTTIAPSGITGPFGEQTSVTLGPDDYWTAIGQGVGEPTGMAPGYRKPEGRF